MAKKCITCKRKLSENLFTHHPLKCDECWDKETTTLDEVTSTSYLKPTKKPKKTKEPQEEHYNLEDKAESDGDKL